MSVHDKFHDTHACCTTKLQQWQPTIELKRSDAYFDDFFTADYWQNINEWHSNEKIKSNQQTLHELSSTTKTHMLTFKLITLVFSKLREIAMLPFCLSMAKNDGPKSSPISSYKTSLKGPWTKHNNHRKSQQTLWTSQLTYIRHLRKSTIECAIDMLLSCPFFSTISVHVKL